MPDEKVAKSLNLSYGTIPMVTGLYHTTDELVTDAVKRAKEFLNGEKDMIVITGGFPSVSENQTNFMKIEEI